MVNTTELNLGYLTVRNRLQPQNLIRDYQDRLVSKSKSTCCAESTSVAIKAERQIVLHPDKKTRVSNSIANFSNEPTFCSRSNQNSFNFDYLKVTQLKHENLSALSDRQKQNRNGSDVLNADCMTQLNSKLGLRISGFSKNSSHHHPQRRSFLRMNENWKVIEKPVENQVNLKTSQQSLQKVEFEQIVNHNRDKCSHCNGTLSLIETSSNPFDSGVFNQLNESVIRTNRPVRRKVNYEKRNANQCSSTGREQNCHRRRWNS